jgi:hypothetical protein
VALFGTVLALELQKKGSNNAAAAVATAVPMAILMGWLLYAYAYRAAKDLRSGTMCCFNGGWQERLSAKRSQQRDCVLFLLPTVTRRPVASYTRRAVADARQAGTSYRWSPAAGQLLYTRVSHLLVSVERTSAQ